jgi:hypothetical protein
MPFTHTCQQCAKEFIASKRAAKFCGSSCFGLSRVAHVVAQNKQRRKYPEVAGITKQQASYRGRNGADSLRDVRKRQELLVALGGACAQCGYSADLRGLVLDHKRGDGYEDRKRFGAKIFRYYIKHLEEAKDRLQVLCATCNQIKAFENREHNRSRRVVGV